MRVFAQCIKLPIRHHVSAGERAGRRPSRKKNRPGANENGPRIWIARAGLDGGGSAVPGLEPRGRKVPPPPPTVPAPPLVAEGGRLHLLDSITIAGVINAD